MSKNLLTTTLFILVIILVIFFRFAYLDLMEFKYDEVAALKKAAGILSTGKLPLTGIMSSVGVKNPPLFIYLTAIWALLFSSPVGTVIMIAIGSIISLIIMYIVAGVSFGRYTLLFLGAFTAVSPWIVIFSRKIWAQNLMLPFITLLLAVLLRAAKKPESRVAFLIVPLAAIIVGLHFSGVCVVASVVIFLLFGIELKNFNFKAFFVGLFVGVGVLAPYFIYLFKGGFASMQTALAEKSGQTPFFTNFVSSVEKSGNVFFSGGSGVLMDRQFEAAFPEITKLASVVSGVSIWLVVGVMVLLALNLATAGMSGSRDFFSGLRSKPEPLLFFIFLVTPLFIYAFLGVKLFNHYFIISIPALFLAVASLFGEAFQKSKKNLMPIASIFTRTVIIVSVIIYVLSGAAWLSAQYYYLTTEGGTRGDYGEAFRYQRKVSEIISAKAGACSEVEYTGLRDKGVGIKYMLKKSCGRKTQKTDDIEDGPKVINLLVSDLKCGSEYATDNIIGPYRICIKD